MQPTQDRVLFLSPDVFPQEAIPAYPTWKFKFAKGGEETWDIERRPPGPPQKIRRPALPGERLRFPDLTWVPDWSENIAWRGRIAEAAAHDTTFQQAQITACRSNILYFFNTFCWCFDPDHPDRTTPFVTFSFQDELITWILWLIASRSEGLVEKSRKMGLTWCVVGIVCWLVLFHPSTVVYLTTLVEDDVDNRTESSLFGKLRLILRNLPIWMRGGWVEFQQGVDSQLLVRIPDNRSYIQGGKTQGTSLRGGRSAFLFADEFAHVEDAVGVLEAFIAIAACKLLGSTPHGASNEFYRIAHDARTKKMSLLWPLHPFKNPEWFELECADPSKTEETIAQEHLISYEKSTTGRVFSQFESVPSAESPWCHLQEGDYFSYDPSYDVVTAADLGIADPTVWLFGQIKPSLPEFQGYTRECLIWFAEEEHTDWTVYDWRYLLNNKGYRYREHIVDIRTGKARDAEHKTWQSRLQEMPVRPLHSKAFKGIIHPGAPITVTGRRYDWKQPVTTLRTRLNIPGAYAINPRACPRLAKAHQNWSFEIDPHTRKPRTDADPKHDQWSHYCKAAMYFVEWRFGLHGKGREVEETTLSSWNHPAVRAVR